MRRFLVFQCIAGFLPLAFFGCNMKEPAPSIPTGPEAKTKAKGKIADELASLREEKRSLTLRIGQAEQNIKTWEEQARGSSKLGQDPSQFEARADEWRSKKSDLEIKRDEVDQKIRSLEGH